MIVEGIGRNGGHQVYTMAKQTRGRSRSRPRRATKTKNTDKQTPPCTWFQYVLHALLHFGIKQADNADDLTPQFQVAFRKYTFGHYLLYVFAHCVCDEFRSLLMLCGYLCLAYRAYVTKKVELRTLRDELDLLRLPWKQDPTRLLFDCLFVWVLPSVAVVLFIDYVGEEGQALQDFLERLKNTQLSTTDARELIHLAVQGLYHFGHWVYLLVPQLMTLMDPCETRTRVARKLRPSSKGTNARK